MISYEQAKQMKDYGFPQKRYKYSKYFINPDTVMNFEDIRDAFDNGTWQERGVEEPVDWLNQFAYIPELVDLIGTQSYELTMEAAVYHYLEGKKQEQEDLIKRTEDAIKTDDMV